MKKGSRVSEPRPTLLDLGISLQNLIITILCTDILHFYLQYIGLFFNKQ